MRSHWRSKEVLALFLLGFSLLVLYFEFLLCCFSLDQFLYFFSFFAFLENRWDKETETITPLFSWKTDPTEPITPLFSWINLSLDRLFLFLNFRRMQLCIIVSSLFQTFPESKQQILNLSAGKAYLVESVIFATLRITRIEPLLLLLHIL